MITVAGLSFVYHIMLHLARWRSRIARIIRLLGFLSGWHLLAMRLNIMERHAV